MGLGAILAVLSAASFALNNAAARRAVVTGTPAQGMALTVPIGVLCFVLAALVSGEIGRVGEFPATSVLWMTGVGLLHFLFGRYCNYRGNQCAGANLTGPVIQLNVVVTLVLAVLVLGEPCTILQVLGGVLMLAGVFTTQQQGSGGSGAAISSKFVPRYAEGYFFASLAALAYGTTPIMTRTALKAAGPYSAIIGGLVSYGAATVVVLLMLALSGPLRRNVMALKRDNISWFVYSGVFVALAQGFLYSAVAVAPIMVVLPLMQVALVFRLLFSTWLNPDHEVFGAKVMIGTAISMVGACGVAIDSGVILGALHMPPGLAQLLGRQL